MTPVEFNRLGLIDKLTYLWHHGEALGTVGADLTRHCLVDDFLVVLTYLEDRETIAAARALVCTKAFA